MNSSHIQHTQRVMAHPHRPQSSILILLFTLLSLVFTTALSCLAAAESESESADYHLAISFDLVRGEITGTAQISIPAGEELSLNLGSLKITGKMLKRQDGSNQSITLPQSTSFSIPAANQARELFLSYTNTFSLDDENLISEKGITLLSDWHPVPDKKMRFTLSARLPENFTAITESDYFPLVRDGNQFSATFSNALYGLHFAAAPYSVSSLKVRQGLQVYALFFPEDASLARGYLNKARDYILRYEREIGPFPYNHYAIVANRQPTGLGMPTFTLLGQAVLRLPFIKDTSLGHEILHSWFGNSIEVDYQHGNWCEGLTSYLADHAYRADRDEGMAYRKEAVLNYLSYVNQSNQMPLASFTNASHNQPLAQARRAIGYSRAMMLFHELHSRLGSELFLKGIRTFYQDYRNSSASWHDIEGIFTQTSQQDLSRFFNERLSREDKPNLAIEQVTLRSFADTHALNFKLRQKTREPYQLHIPVRVATTQGEVWFTVKTENIEQEITLELDSPPLGFTLDPQYDFFRMLSEDERPAVWSQFMGATEKIALFSGADTPHEYQPLLEQLQNDSLKIQNDDYTGNSELAESNLLFLGLAGKHVQSLFGSPSHPGNGFTLEVRPNPLNPDHVTVLVTSSGPAQAASAASKLSHYGKYSFLHFENGHIKAKRINDSFNGIQIAIEHLPRGGATSNLQSFGTIADQLSNNDVIYLGEQHTSMSDHRLQLRIIEAIHARHPDIAIGMEMFPYTSQEALDQYTAYNSAMTEKEFLKASGYFSVWSYDYRYFQDIFSFARKNSIPVIGLNLPRETVSTVYSSGGTDALSKEIRDSLPQQRDLSLPGYARQLRQMQSLHQQGGHGSGYASGFIQAQSLWDETMAEEITDHLNKNPGRKLIVLAGSQHTRKDFGIPPRVARRTNVEQASILNIFNGTTPDNLADIADYFFLVESLELPEPGKIGISINEPTAADANLLTISAFNQASKADEAGLRITDSIVAIDDFPIHSMEDVRIALFASLPGDVVQLKIRRTENGFDKEIMFEVELIKPVREQAHP
ncbi:ChaN family lipoprotein [Desulfosediminicola sp.]|uniref:ChaN family lipoprotein n=1 Tax=Desulfosediminicola sp. TaxID=2886825 RepID=UPI003AF2C99A